MKRMVGSSWNMYSILTDCISKTWLYLRWKQSKIGCWIHVRLPAYACVMWYVLIPKRNLASTIHLTIFGIHVYIIIWKLKKMVMRFWSENFWKKMLDKFEKFKYHAQMKAIKACKMCVYTYLFFCIIQMVVKKYTNYMHENWCYILVIQWTEINSHCIVNFHIKHFSNPHHTHF